MTVERTADASSLGIFLFCALADRPKKSRTLKPRPRRFMLVCLRVAKGVGQRDYGALYSPTQAHQSPCRARTCDRPLDFTRLNENCPPDAKDRRLRAAKG